MPAEVNHTNLPLPKPLFRFPRAERLRRRPAPAEIDTSNFMQRELIEQQIMLEQHYAETDLHAAKLSKQGRSDFQPDKKVLISELPEEQAQGTAVLKEKLCCRSSAAAEKHLLTAD
ncbi:hypothetical protein [Enterobacter hormaechei]|uniref:hypothetical protein n=1 Tax=Enterobacter hormaechei TaxID=158836 RepID=UPI002E1808D3|nr:hypothetical protein [Enterobacter hormaechei]